MENQITESFLQEIAGDVEKLLLDDRESIAFAYKKVGTGLKLSIGVTLDPTAEGIAVNYSISYDLEPKPEPPEKHNVKYRRVINEAQGRMEL